MQPNVNQKSDPLDNVKTEVLAIHNMGNGEIMKRLSFSILSRAEKVFFSHQEEQQETNGKLANSTPG